MRLLRRLLEWLGVTWSFDEPLTDQKKRAWR